TPTTTRRSISAENNGSQSIGLWRQSSRIRRKPPALAVGQLTQCLFLSSCSAARLRCSVRRLLVLLTNHGAPEACPITPLSPSRVVYTAYLCSPHCTVAERLPVRSSSERKHRRVRGHRW